MGSWGAHAAPASPPSASDTVEVRGLEIDCIVGVYPSERGTPQPLVLDLTLSLDTRGAALQEDLHATVDYGRLTGDVRFLLERCRFLLVETAAEVIARYVLLPPLHGSAQVTCAHVRLTKPKALADGALARVTITRTLNDVTTVAEPHPYGSCESVFVGRGCAVQRRRVHSLAPFTHAEGEAHELVLSDGMRINGALAAIGTAYAFAAGQARSYAAAHASVGIALGGLLCVRHPPRAVDVVATGALVTPAGVMYTAPGARGGVVRG